MACASGDAFGRSAAGAFAFPVLSKLFLQSMMRKSLIRRQSPSGNRTSAVVCLRVSYRRRDAADVVPTSTLGAPESRSQPVVLGERGQYAAPPGVLPRIAEDGKSAFVGCAAGNPDFMGLQTNMAVSCGEFEVGRNLSKLLFVFKCIGFTKE